MCIYWSTYRYSHNPIYIYWYTHRYSFNPMCIYWYTYRYSSNPMCIYWYTHRYLGGNGVLLCPFLTAFFMQSLHLDTPRVLELIDPSSISEQVLLQVEADSFWCYSAFMRGMNDLELRMGVWWPLLYVNVIVGPAHWSEWNCFAQRCFNAQR